MAEEECEGAGCGGMDYTEDAALSAGEEGGGVVIRRLLHCLAHRLRLNLGYPITWRRWDGVLMAGFRCKGCGKVTMICPVWISYRHKVRLGD